MEYHVDQGLTTDKISWTSAEMFQYNADRYIEILHSEDASNVDILVFPENTLNRQATAVIIPNENEFDLDLCTNSTYNVNLRLTLPCNSTEVSRITFLDISIDGNFPTDASSVLTMPTSLDFNITSLPTSQFEFQKTQDK